MVTAVKITGEYCNYNEHVTLRGDCWITQKNKPSCAGRKRWRRVEVNVKDPRNHRIPTETSNTGSKNDQCALKKKCPTEDIAEESFGNFVALAFRIKGHPRRRASSTSMEERTHPILIQTDKYGKDNEKCDGNGKGKGSK